MYCAGRGTRMPKAYPLSFIVHFVFLVEKIGLFSAKLHSTIGFLRWLVEMCLLYSKQNRNRSTLGTVVHEVLARQNHVISHNPQGQLRVHQVDVLERLPMPRPGEVLRDVPQRRRRRSPLPISRRRGKILLSREDEEEELLPLCPLAQRTSQRILDAISHPISRVIYSKHVTRRADCTI